MASNDFPLSERDKLLKRLRGELESSAQRLRTVIPRTGLDKRNIQRTVAEAPLLQEDKIRNLQDLANRTLQRAERLGTRRREDRLSKERKDRALTAFEILQKGSLGRRELDLMQKRIQNTLKLGKRELDITEMLGVGELGVRQRGVREKERQGKSDRELEREARDILLNQDQREADELTEKIREFYERQNSGGSARTPFSNEINESLGFGRR